MCLCPKESIVISGVSYLKKSVEAYLKELGPIVHLTGRNHPMLGCHVHWSAISGTTETLRFFSGLVGTLMVSSVRCREPVFGAKSVFRDSESEDEG